MSDPNRWRAMTRSDLERVKRIADLVHQDYPEDACVFADRLEIYPGGCLVLGRERVLAGYAIGHPWLYERPPALNARIEGLPSRPDTFHIHDLALLPETRGSGLGTDAVAHFVKQAELLKVDRMSLIAVGPSLPFWRKHGFETVGPGTPDISSYGRNALFMVRTLR